jgi:hypothetical protein
MDLHFVSAPGGSAFMHELLTGVAYEVAQCIPGTAIDSVHVSEGPLTGADDDVFVVVPHEFFRVLPPEQHPSAEQRRRTIGFCVEHPGTDTFTTTMAFARELGACVDINDDSALALFDAGVRVDRFRLGYTSAWDRWKGADSHRSCDVLYLGTADDRRSRYLSMQPDALTGYEIRLATPPHEPMTKTRPDFLMGEEKFQLLADSKLLVNLHRESSRSFEWVRALEAMSNGCVVVSEHSTDHRPLVPGEHFVAAAPNMVVEVARALLEHPDRLESIRRAAYDFIRTELTMRSSAAALVELAVTIDAPHARPQNTTAPASRQWPLWPLDQVPFHVENDPSLDVTSFDLVATDTTTRASPPAASRHPDSVDVIILHSAGAVPGDTEIADLLRDLAGGGDAAARVFFAGQTERWTEGLKSSIRSDVDQRTSGAAANDALQESDAEFVLVLESVDELLPTALARLLSAVRASNADLTYGFVITPSGSFRSQWPFEAQRVLERNYLATASLWRRTALQQLGGWNESLPTTAAITWDLWRRFARRNGPAVHIPRPIVVQRLAQSARPK